MLRTIVPWPQLILSVFAGAAVESVASFLLGSFPSITKFLFYLKSLHSSLARYYFRLRDEYQEIKCETRRRDEQIKEIIIWNVCTCTCLLLASLTINLPNSNIPNASDFGWISLIKLSAIVRQRLHSAVLVCTFRSCNFYVASN